MAIAPPAVRNVVRLGAEASFGAGGAVTRQPLSFGMSAAENTEFGSVTVPGALYATKSFQTYEDVTLSVADSIMSYEDAPIVFESLLHTTTATTPANGSLSRQRIYKDAQWVAQAFQSYVAEVVNTQSGRGGKSAAVFFTEAGFGVDPTSETVELTGSAMGKAIGNEGMTADNLITKTDFTPVLPNHFKLWVSDTVAGLGQSANEVHSAFSTGFSLGDRRAVVRYIQRANVGTYQDVTETRPSTEVPLTLADKTDEAVDELIGWAREGKTVFVRLEAIGPQIEMSTAATPAPINNMIRCDFACGMTDKSREDSQEVYSRNFTYQMLFSEALGSPQVITVVNNKTAVL